MPKRARTTARSHCLGGDPGRYHGRAVICQGDSEGGCEVRDVYAKRANLRPGLFEGGPHRFVSRPRRLLSWSPRRACGPAADQIELAVGMVAGPDQRPGFDVGKPQVQRLLFELREFLRRDVAGHRQVLA